MLIAYDLETSRIESGTPRLLYLTAFGESFRVSMPISGDDRLQTFCTILETYFLLPELNKSMFVAWNGNNYDAYFVAQALLKSDQWILLPYMTASKALRGLGVKSKRKFKIDGKWRILQYRFLDGISMTGMVGKSLKAFLQTFAPELPKLDIGNLDEVDFNPNDPLHRAYAERDSEGLYIAMSRVQSIIADLTSDGGHHAPLGLKPTIGNIAINYFMSNVPSEIKLLRPAPDFLRILHGPVKRGGYCWCMKQYVGNIWKYDLNQAYAAAMRDASLPAGDATATEHYIPGLCGVYFCSMRRSTPSQVPFYYKSDSDNVGRFTTGSDPVETWITSIEIEHLRCDDWTVDVQFGWVWSDIFNFSDVVNRLEILRSSDPLGPSGPLGTMVKAIGNNAYGKTLEKLNNLELILANECPEGYDVYDPFDAENSIIFSRERFSFPKKYHLPQIGVFVTAHVRCLVRDTALLSPKHFLYADTDCVVFSKNMVSKLNIDKTKYGAWKIEAANVPYIIVGKKIYYGDDGSTKAKGLRIKELSRSDYENWLITQPEQNQIQRQNFLKFLSGSDMFKSQIRKGTDVSGSKIYGVRKGVYIPK